MFNSTAPENIRKKKTTWRRLEDPLKIPLFEDVVMTTLRPKPHMNERADRH